MTRRSLSRLLPALLFAVLMPACAFHTTARAWNGRVGADGAPVFYTSTTKVGLKFLVIVPFLGNLDIDGMVEDLTGEIEAVNGDHVRIVQGASESYWYGFPPVTWVLTPVISRVDAEWRPTGSEFTDHRDLWAGRIDTDGDPVEAEDEPTGEGLD